MYIATVPNRNSPPAILLRAGYREGGKVKNRTLANLSAWPRQKIEALRLLLKGEKLAPLGTILELAGSRRRVRARAALAAMKRLGFEKVIAPAPSRERELIADQIIALLLAPARGGDESLLPGLIGASAVREDERELALKWLALRQDLIEEELAGRCLEKGGWAILGLSRDSRENALYGMLADPRGLPVSISVQANDAPELLLSRVRKMKEKFGVGTIALVADRGLHAEERFGAPAAAGGLDWVAPVNTRTIASLVESRVLRPELFDPSGYFDFGHPDFPGERFAAFRDPETGAALNEVSVLRTSLSTERLSAEKLFGGYKNLARTRRSFSSIKITGLRGRPHRRREEALRRLFFLRMLACHVERQMRPA